MPLLSVGVDFPREGEFVEPIFTTPFVSDDLF